MKRYLLFFAAITAVFLSCSKTETEKTSVLSIVPQNSKVSGLKPGDTYQIKITVFYTDGTSSPYDFSSDPLKLSMTSSNTNALKVDRTGLVSILDYGSESIIIKATDGSGANCIIRFSLVKQFEPYDISKPFNASMKYFVYHMGGFDMQNFDIDSKGNVYTSFSKSFGSRGYQGIMYHTLAGESGKEMILYYSSHGDAISVEEVDGVPYIWASTFGSKSSDGTYANSQMFCRIRFEAGKEYTPEQIAESGDCFWAANLKGVKASRDKVSGRIAILTNESSGEYTNRIRVYEPKDLMAAPKKQVTTNSMKRGGDWKGPIAKEVTETATVTVHDISSVTPVADFRFTKSKVYGYKKGTSTVKSMQGFCFYDEHIYFSNDSDRTNRDVTLSILDLNGTLLSGPSHILTVDNINAIRAAGLCGTDSYLESEGIQFRDGVMYSGWLSWDATGCFDSIMKF